MTPLEARITALEQDVLVICAAIHQLSASQTLFASMATKQLGDLLETVKRLRDDLSDGDEWKDFG